MDSGNQCVPEYVSLIIWMLGRCLGEITRSNIYSVMIGNCRVLCVPTSYGDMSHKLEDPQKEALEKEHVFLKITTDRMLWMPLIAVT